MKGIYSVDENPHEQSYEKVFMVNISIEEDRKPFVLFFKDVLFPFINQVEFMAKNPILIMFYAEG